MYTLTAYEYGEFVRWFFLQLQRFVGILKENIFEIFSINCMSGQASGINDSRLIMAWVIKIYDSRLTII